MLSRLPESLSTRNRILDREDEQITTPARLTTEAERKGGLMSLLNKTKAREEGVKPEPKQEPEVTVRVKIVGVDIKQPPKPIEEPKRETVDGGDLTPEPKSAFERMEEIGKRNAAIWEQARLEQEAKRAALPPPPVVVSQPWAAHYLVNLGEQIEKAQRLIEYHEIETEKPAVAPKVSNPFAKKTEGIRMSKLSEDELAALKTLMRAIASDAAGRATHQPRCRDNIKDAEFEVRIAFGMDLHPEDSND